MHRVLSFPTGMSGRGFGESNEFITKRMCFSFIFFIGFLALLGGFLLGRITTQRKMQLREDQKCPKLIDDVLEVTGSDFPRQLQYNLLLEELKNSSFDQFLLTKKSGKEPNEDDHIDNEIVRSILSDSNLFHKVVQRRSSIVATLRGSHEPDRCVVLSVGGDGIEPALEVVEIFGKLRAVHKWEPQRTIIFCFSDQLDDSCRDIFPKYFKSRIVAYLAIHGKAIEKKGCLVASGSDIVKSVVLGRVEELISQPDFYDGRDFDWCKIGDDFQRQILTPRILSDIPHASLSFKSGNATSTGSRNEKEVAPYRRILTRIIALSIWKLSDSAILHWDPKVFERGVKTALKMINSSQFSEFKEKIVSTTKKLVDNAQSLSQKTSGAGDSGSLDNRMRNDLLMDLDRALLCPDVDFRSKTDLALIPGLLSEPQDAMSSFLVNMLKCYDEAVQVVQEG